MGKDMKIEVSINLQNFYSEFESCDEWVRNEIKSQVLAAVKKSPEVKALAAQCVERAVADLHIRLEDAP